MKDNFIAYRYPNDGSICYVSEYDDEDVFPVYSFNEVGKRHSFVFAPFAVTEKSPIVQFFNGNVSKVDLSELHDMFHEENDNGDSEAFQIVGTVDDRDVYHRDFSLFHDATCFGKMSKIVLARSRKIVYRGNADVLTFYERACERNPSSFVAIVSSKLSGTWLIATPEILLERVAGECHTISLAGTMNLDEDLLTALRKGNDIADVWCEKNILEQRIVSAYINDVLSTVSDDVKIVGPYSFVAGNVVHLRSDFKFTLRNGETKIGDLLEKLHPTPAVCGMPKDKAFSVIVDKEHIDRKYYSGFCGTVNDDLDAHLYVTLRCMKINDGSFELFAGGGILPESNECDEWNETFYKMQAMMRSIGL